MMEEYDVRVSTVPGLYSYPYVARILGKDAQYIFKREFLRYAQVTRSLSGDKYYTVELPGNGVYEECIKRKNRDGEVVERERNWFVFADGDYAEIDRSEVLDAVADPSAAVRRFYGDWED